MVTVIGVRFKKAGKVYYFDPSEVWPNPGDYVVVETARGVEMGEVVTGAREVEDNQIVQPLKKVVRMAVEEDIRRVEYNEQREKEAFRVAQDKIAHHKLDMKLVDVEYTFDNSKIVFYFTANGRVDFRDLVKDMASVFKMRIELRQIGVRDEAKMLGGLGSCGRQICCDAFLGDFQPVSIKMAKEQNLSLNPTKISGQCGRLMCCLKYEQDYYDSALKKLPKLGRECVTPDGAGIVSDINVIREKVRVRMRTSEDTIEVREYSLEEIQKPVPHEGSHGSGEAAKQKQIEGARRAAKAARMTPVPPKEGEGPSSQEQQQERNRQRRIASKSKSKQLSTEQFLDKLKDEDADSESVNTANASHAKEVEAPEGSELRLERNRRSRRRRGGGSGAANVNGGENDADSKVQKSQPKESASFNAGVENIKSSDVPSVRPGDTMNS